MGQSGILTSRGRERRGRCTTAALRRLGDRPGGSDSLEPRLLAKKLNLCQSTVSRIWRAFGLKPHRSQTFVLSKDPQLVQKVRDMVFHNSKS